MMRALIKGSLSVGHRQLDAEHEEFAVLSDALVESVGAERPPAEIAALAARLVGHALDHFSSEERILGDVGYAGLEPAAFAAHVDEHNRIRLQIVGLLGAPHFTCDKALSIRMLLADHLLHWDIMYKSFIEQFSLNARSRPAISKSYRIFQLDEIMSCSACGR